MKDKTRIDLSKESLKKIRKGFKFYFETPAGKRLLPATVTKRSGIYVHYSLTGGNLSNDFDAIGNIFGNGIIIRTV